jgi:ABC-type Zn uptake system ZnuABC Zn-binding protein ZnuA
MIFLVAAACAGAPSASRTSKIGAIDDEKLYLVATTNIVGDVVQQIGGDLVQVEVLLPPGADPHSFDAAPNDVAKVANADYLFASGAGLEGFLEPLLESAGKRDAVLQVSEGVELLESHEVEASGPEHRSGDPHTWFDPNNVMIWTENIENKLVELDPANREVYSANAADYRDQLEELDGWIREQVETIPRENRKLVSDHALLTYFANRYGFELVGAVIPGYSTLAEPSAQEVARLEDAIHSLGVKAVFVGESQNPSLAEQVAEDTGIQIVALSTGTLARSGGDPTTYLEMMRHNVTVIVQALR